MFKVLTRTSNKGFTIIELLVGLIITVLIGGLAMDAIIRSSATFANDKRDIDNGQNLSAILEIVGNDIKQAGEQIPDVNFPAIEIQQASPPIYLTSGNTTLNDSSTITIRRALTLPLTLCEDIDIDANPTRVTVADDTSTNAGCIPFPPIPGVVILPIAAQLAEAQNYRCKLGAPDANYNVANPDYCPIAAASVGYNAALQKVRVVVSDLQGHFRTFNYSGEDTTNAPNKLKMILTPAMPASDAINKARNNVLYSAGSAAVYLIEERTYSLNSDGNLTVAVNGDPESILIKGIARFKVAAKEYTANITDKVINPTPLNQCTSTNYDAVDLPPSTPTKSNPAYSCKFNFNTAVGDPARNWKQIAGVKVKLQARYDPTGRDANPTGDLKTKMDEKLSVTAEFFPRNVLSK